jgi:hypothetical protein
MENASDGLRGHKQPELQLSARADGISVISSCLAPRHLLHHVLRPGASSSLDTCLEALLITGLILKPVPLLVAGKTDLAT